MTVSNQFDRNNDLIGTTIILRQKKTGKVVVLRFKGNPLLNSAIFKSRDAVLDYGYLDVLANLERTIGENERLIKKISF